MTDVFRTLILPIDDVPLGRDIANAFPGVGPEMFSAYLSASGVEPASHAISSGMVPTVFADVIPLKTWVNEEGVWQGTIVQSGNAQVVMDTAVSMGLSVDLQQAQGVMDAMDVSEQPPFEAMNRLGLKIINSQ